MQNAIIILKQLCIMYFYIGIGYFLFKRKFISVEGSKSLANILIYAILPATIIQSFCSEVGRREVKDLILSIFLGLLTLLLSMSIAFLLFRKRPVDNFGAAFSNATFMGIPLITAILGPEAVFFVTGTSALLNIFQWYYGQGVLGKQRLKIRSTELFKNPLLSSFLTGVVLFLCRVSLPDMVISPLRTLQNMNAPVGMIVLGVYLAQTNIRELFLKKELYVVSAVRLLVIPFATLFVLRCFPMVPFEVRLVFLIVASAPIGSNVAVYAQKYGADNLYAVKTVCFSTAFSIVSMPFCIYAASVLW